MAGLASLEMQADGFRREKGVKNFRTFQNGDGAENQESGEICDRMVRNPRQEDVKELPPTLLQTIKDSFTEPPTSSAVEARKRLSNVSKKPVDEVTSGDHSKLAVCVGNGNLQAGFERLQEMPEDEVNIFALRLRKDASDADSIRREVNGRVGVSGTR
jgi:hypothetical protein